jgi:hypothetical protein
MYTPLLPGDAVYPHKVFMGHMTYPFSLGQPSGIQNKKLSVGIKSTSVANSAVSMA